MRSLRLSPFQRRERKDTQSAQRKLPTVSAAELVTQRTSRGLIQLKPLWKVTVEIRNDNASAPRAEVEIERVSPGLRYSSERVQSKTIRPACPSVPQISLPLIKIRRPFCPFDSQPEIHPPIWAFP